eukprot:scaffold135053_cov30-Tisochrysis_lutea.AAC.1
MVNLEREGEVGKKKQRNIHDAWGDGTLEGVARLGGRVGQAGDGDFGGRTNKWEEKKKRRARREMAGIPRLPS